MKCHNAAKVAGGGEVYVQAFFQFSLFLIDRYTVCVCTYLALI